MKKLFTILAAVLLTTTVWAQSPEKMSYQAVIRNSSDALVTNQQVGMQISILQGTSTGTAVYVETQTPTTNANGLVSLEIGAGTVVSGDFTTIDWANGPYFIETKTDPAGGISYTITGTSQLLSVPYALHAKTAETVTGGITETDPVFTTWDKSTGISITESQISDLGNYIETETDPAVAANFDFTGAANGDLLQFNGTKWVKVTPTYISDYTVTESDVTSHQAALSITESQISDLGTYIETETDPVFTTWDKSTGISITESQISDLGTYIKTEIDPVYSGSQAANITATDITNLGNLSGINTGDQDISGIAINTQAIQDTASQIRADIPTVTTYSVGDFAQGGIVFWVDETGQHGLVAAKVDQNGGSSIQWYNGSNTDTEAHGDGVYAGEMNTMLIIANQGSNSNDYAAGVCANYTVTESGVTYGDWYLPSKEELDLMYQNMATIDATAGANGGSSFASVDYWSSTEYGNNYAWRQSFDLGFQSRFGKINTYRVRAVRAF